MLTNVNLACTTVTPMLIVWTLILAFCVYVGLAMKGVESYAVVCISQCCIYQYVRLSFVYAFLQILMNAVEERTVALPVHTVLIQREVSHAHADLVTLVMESCALVIIYIMSLIHVVSLSLTTTDIDECSSGTDNCNENADCTNAIGTFTCSCVFGYTGDGVTCTGKYSITNSTYFAQDYYNCIELVYDLI